MARRSRSDGLRITKVGLWFLLFGLIILLAAANTGNNGLYLVLGTMVGMFLVADVMARWNVFGLDVGLEPPAEIFANRPSYLEFEVRNRSRFLPRWLLILEVDLAASPAATAERRLTPSVVPHLAPQASQHGQLELLVHRRGRQHFRFVHLTSLFPLGFFRKGRRYPVDFEVLVFPEIFSPSTSQPEQAGRSGDEATRRPGWGHELLSLREFRTGDDPRSIHWKQTARTGKLIYQQRETEESPRLSIVFDNAVGKLETRLARDRFERLVSEAATAALDYLGRGYQVALLTRDGLLPFAAGPRQRQRILETLALVEPQPQERERLLDLSQAPYLSLAMEPQEVGA